jgi:hypothetical protein
VTRYPSDRLREEVAYVAFHFHWQLDDILRLDHGERLHWVTEIARLNERINDRGSDRGTPRRR